MIVYLATLIAMAALYYMYRRHKRALERHLLENRALIKHNIDQSHEIHRTTTQLKEQMQAATKIHEGLVDEITKHKRD